MCLRWMCTVYLEQLLGINASVFISDMKMRHLTQECMAVFKWLSNETKSCNIFPSDLKHTVTVEEKSVAKADSMYLPVTSSIFYILCMYFFMQNCHKTLTSTCEGSAKCAGCERLVS